MKKGVLQTCTLTSLVFAAAITAALVSQVMAMTPPKEDRRPAVVRRTPPEPEIAPGPQLSLAVFGEDRRSETLRLEDNWGVTVGNVYLTQGHGTTGTLPAGTYRLVGQEGTASFSLGTTGAVRRLSGPCWTTGTDLHYGAARGSVTISCPTTPWATAYYYDLVGEGSVYGLTVEFDPRDAGSGVGTVYGLPLGTYRVLESGQTRAVCSIGPEKLECEIDGGTWPAAPGR